MDVSFLTAKAHRVDHGDGDAQGRSVADEPIAPGEVVAAFGGHYVTGSQLTPQAHLDALQIEDDLFLLDSRDAELRLTVRHSCEPNCALSGSVVLVARRAIAAGEELTYDHATAMGDVVAEFACTCGAPTCRGTISGHDWMLPELQLCHRGHFSPFLARRIAALAPIGAERRAFAL